MKTKTFLVLVPAVIASAYALAQVTSRATAPDPSTIRIDGWITTSEILYNQDNSIQAAWKETITVDATAGKILTVRKAVNPVLDTDDTFFQLADLTNSVGTQWFVHIPLKTTITLGTMSRSDKEYWWLAEQCSTLLEKESPDEGTTVKLLGESVLQPGNVKVYGIEFTARPCCESIKESTEYRIRTEYRAPQFGCVDVQFTQISVRTDGTDRMYNEKRIVAAGKEIDPRKLLVPQHYAEASRAKVIQELRAQRGQKWPATPSEFAAYDQIEKNYQRNKIH